MTGPAQLGAFSKLTFNKRKKKQPVKALDAYDFECLCHEATKRVQDNQAHEQKVHDKFYNKDSNNEKADCETEMDAYEMIRKRLLTPNVKEIDLKNEVLDPHTNPSVLLRKKQNQRSAGNAVGNRGVSLSMKLQETHQDRRLQHYSNYLQMWDNYEGQIAKHFRHKNIVKYGSSKNAKRIM